jgi:hypothetical protein
MSCVLKLIDALKLDNGVAGMEWLGSSSDLLSLPAKDAVGCC